MRSHLAPLIIATIAALTVLLLVRAPARDAAAAHRTAGDSVPRHESTEPIAREDIPIAQEAPLARSTVSATEEPKAPDTEAPDKEVASTVPSDDGSNAPTLTVRAVDAAGAPIPGALVGIRFVDPVSFHDREATDAAGEARFGLATTSASQPLEVWATAPDRGLASRKVRLAAIPEQQPFILVLVEGGWLDMTVLESTGGLPVAGARVSVSIETSSRHNLSSVETDASGFAALGPLVAGLRPWYVGAPSGEHNVRDVSEIVPGQRTVIEVVLDQDGEPLALEGVFVDENNVARASDYFEKADSQPIDRPTMWVGPSRAEGKIVHSDAYGRFRVYMPPCDELVVLLNVGPNGHRYDPESMTVPFGTRGLRLRIAERYESVTTRFDVRDSASGEPVSDAQVIVYRDDPWKAMESCITRSPEPGSYVVQHRDWPDLHYIVRSIGHEHAYGTLDRSTREAGIQVEVIAGLRSPVVILDSATLNPIGGARFVNEAGDTVATSTPDGAAVLKGAPASGPLRVVADGYAPRRWYASWPTPRVTLVQE